MGLGFRVSGRGKGGGGRGQGGVPKKMPTKAFGIEGNFV